jgi:hypothetical protein
MATADISKMAVFDQRIVQNPPRYAVDKGALSLTNAPFNAIATSASQMTFNINVPSQNVFVDRAVDWSSTVYLKVGLLRGASGAGAAYANGVVALTLGQNAALSAFPLHELTSTMTATINDTSVVINTDTVLKEVLRMTDYAKNRLARTCPTMLDRYKSYNDALFAINSPLSGYSEQTAAAEAPNGAWYDIDFVGTTGQAYPFNNGIPQWGDTGYLDGGEGAVGYVYLRFRSTEKLVLSPFIFADCAEWETGLFGINNIQLVMNMKGGNQLRVLRSADANADGGAAVGPNIVSEELFDVRGSPFEGAAVNVQFLTPSLDIPLPAKSVVPYLEFPRYINANLSPLATGASATYQSTTIVLPQIPDMLIIYAKPQSYSYTDADYYLPIDQISLNFDNFAGLLSSHTPQQLYQMAVHNGLEMTFEQWVGRARVSAPPLAGATGTNKKIQTVGGFLVLKPGQDFALQSGQAPSLIGNFTLQFNCRINNYSADAVQPVLFVIAVNSGFFETLAGSSRIIKGVLSEADIIAAEPIAETSREGLKRLVGHGFFSSLGSILSKAKDIYTATKPAVSAIKGMLPEGKIKDIMGKVGYGMAGAGMAGAGYAGAGMAGAGKKSLAARLM